MLNPTIFFLALCTTTTATEYSLSSAGCPSLAMGFFGSSQKNLYYSMKKRVFGQDLQIDSLITEYTLWKDSGKGAINFLVGKEGTGKSEIAAVLLEHDKGVKVIKEDVYSIESTVANLKEVFGQNSQPLKVIVFDNAEDLVVSKILRMLTADAGISFGKAFIVIIHNNVLNAAEYNVFAATKPTVITLTPLNDLPSIHHVSHFLLQQQLCSRGMSRLTYTKTFIEKIQSRHTRTFSAKETTQILTAVVATLFSYVGHIDGLQEATLDGTSGFAVIAKGERYSLTEEDIKAFFSLWWPG
eukprot:TRINITY_DN37392_c0_g1_i1.p1 TRINITY_DN37392_c0_g1~~TRINITY_DN37392_c0_g1_i1.p1  ORF type:complete len:307 (+),score=43.46 TRINITY_DN37392_c0_g1_i1:30-923(+)